MAANLQKFPSVITDYAEGVLLHVSDERRHLAR